MVEQNEAAPLMYVQRHSASNYSSLMLTLQLPSLLPATLSLPHTHARTRHRPFRSYVTAAAVRNTPRNDLTKIEKTV